MRQLLLLVIACLAVLKSAIALKDTFGSKSSYGFSEGDQGHQLGENCKAKALFMVVRHGSRYPTIKHIRSFHKLQKVLEHLNWIHSFEEHDEGLLTPIGVSEMRKLGKRIRNTFASLFSDHPRYHPRKFEFRASQTHRTLQSANAFALGMFETDQVFAIESDSKQHDNLLRFHENCPSYVKLKKGLTPKLDEIVNVVLESVRDRVGLDVASFDRPSLIALWRACLFEGSVLHELNGTCTFFTRKDAEMLEYVNDVEDYWEKSFGQHINHQISCLLVKEAVDSLRKSKIRFLFGHAETIMPLVAFLDFFKDDKPLGEKFELEQDRKWRSGVVSPFAANVAFVLYTCAGSEIEYVQVRHNEKLMNISHLCPETDDINSCPFDQFSRALQEKLEACQFKEMCQVTVEEELGLDTDDAHE